MRNEKTKTLECVITSPQKTETYGGLSSVSLPAFRGRLQILPGHAEAFFLLGKGDIVLDKGGASSAVGVESGACHVRGGRVLVIVPGMKV